MNETRLGTRCRMQSERRLDTTMVRLSGEFDLGCENAFFEELGRALDSHASTLILDLRTLDFIDSTGLRMLVSLNRVADSDGFDFTVFCGKGMVGELLHRTGLDGVLSVVYPSGGVVPATDVPV